MSQVGVFSPAVANPAYSGEQSEYVRLLRLRLDERSRTLLTFDTLGAVAAYDLDSLRPTSDKVLPLPGFAHGMLVQQGRGRTLVATASGARENPTGEIDVVRVVKGRPTLAGRLVLTPTDLGGEQRHVMAMAEQPDSPYVYLLSGVVVAGTYVPRTLTVTLLDVGAVESGRGRVVWSHPLPDCETPTSVKSADLTSMLPAAFGYSARRQALMVGCSSADAIFGKAPVPVGAGMLALVPGATKDPPTPAKFSIFGFPGIVRGWGVWESRSERLILETNVLNVAETLYAFDARTLSYVGGVGAGSNQLAALGTDSVHSRLYALSPLSETGLVVTDLQPVPVDLGHVYPEFSHRFGRASPVDGAVVVDGRTGRLFASYGPHGYLVMRDTVPYYTPPALADPDAGTVDRPERPGVTGADFGAAAQAYGAVVRQVGGTRNLLFNAVPIGLGVEPVGGGTRELDLAYLTKLSLDDRSANAATITADRDKASTQADEQSLPQGTAVKWPYSPVQCGDFGGAPKSAGTSAAHVVCDSARARVSATAVAGPSEVAAVNGSPLVEIGEASYASSAERTSTHGATATVTSTVKGLSILGGALQIAEVQVQALARAHGRPGTAAGTFVRRVKGVTVDGVPLCEEQCDLESVAEHVNASLAGRLHIAFPAPEAVPAKGSPRGAVTVIRRLVEEQTEAQLLDQQDPTRQEVPGMVVRLYQDNNVPARTVMMFAGASVEAHYLIYPLGGDEPTAAPPAPATAAGAPTVVAPVPDVPLPDRPVVAAPSDQAPPASGVVDKVVSGIRLVVNGLSVVWHLLGVWLVLLLPVHLSARRWLLLRRASLEEGAA